MSSRFFSALAWRRHRLLLHRFYILVEFSVPSPSLTSPPTRLDERFQESSVLVLRNPCPEAHQPSTIKYVDRLNLLTCSSNTRTRVPGVATMNSQRSSSIRFCCSCPSSPWPPAGSFHFAIIVQGGVIHYLPTLAMARQSLEVASTGQAAIGRQGRKLQQKCGQCYLELYPAGTPETMRVKP